MSLNSLKVSLIFLVFCLSTALYFSPGSYACTGIQLTGNDKTVARGRTMEWGSFNMNTRILVVPRGTLFKGQTPEGMNGAEWKSRYGYAGLAVLEGMITDGMNEAGLSAGGFFHSGFAKYHDYDPERSDISMAPSDFLAYILSNFATIDEMKEDIAEIRVVPVVAEKIGMPWPAHAMVTEPTGKCAVIEFTDGEIKIYDNPVGVITNNPDFPWHLTNLRNYGYISDKPFESKKWGGMDIDPLASGSGMLGLPGDFTSPSRFVRAVVFSQYSRATSGGQDTIQEIFRILDSFNEGMNQAEGSDAKGKTDMPSATQWTVAHDTKNLITYYHTMYNRRIRSLDLSRIDFSRNIAREIPLDENHKQDIQDITELLR